MNVLKTIFINSIIYKLFSLFLLTYENSRFKIFCQKCFVIYKHSFIDKGVQNYINSTPIYKYSFIKKINEHFYYFIVNHTKWLYNLVDKTVNNSFFIKAIKKEYEVVKVDCLRNTFAFLAVFLGAFSLGALYLHFDYRITGMAVILEILCLIVFAFSNVIKRVFFGSFVYNTALKILELEGYNEKK